MTMFNHILAMHGKEWLGLRPCGLSQAEPLWLGLHPCRLRMCPCGLGCALTVWGCTLVAWAAPLQTWTGCALVAWAVPLQTWAVPSWLELRPRRLGLRPCGLGCTLVDSDGLCPCALMAWAAAAAAAVAAVEVAAVTAAVVLAAAAVEVYPNGWGNRAWPGRGLHPRRLKHNNQMAVRQGLVVMQQKICHYAAAGSGYLPYDVNIGIVNMMDYCKV
jgi:hypothetical protein